MSASSDSEKTAARWMPFQCPTCFALFRLQKGNAGRRGHCPQCHVVLTVPVFGKEYASFQGQKKTASEAKTIALARVEDPEEVKSWKDSPSQRKRKYIGESDEVLNWEEAKSEEEKPYSWMVACSCALMVAVLSAVGIYLVKNAPSKKGWSTSVVIGDAASAAALEKSLILPENTSYLNEEGVDVTKKKVEEYEKFDVVKIENAVKKFMTSGSIQERLAFTRDPERVKPLMEKYLVMRSLSRRGSKNSIGVKSDIVVIFSLRSSGLEISLPGQLRSSVLKIAMTFPIGWIGKVGWDIVRCRQRI